MKEYKKNDIIEVTAHIHPDGEVYIGDKAGMMEYVGWLTAMPNSDDLTMEQVENIADVEPLSGYELYTKAKRISLRRKKVAKNK